jgi:hypothetical protein
MMMLSAWWGLGYAALLVATIGYGWYNVRRLKVNKLTGDVLIIVATVLLWLGLVGRAAQGHGWPFVSPADRATGVALLTLLIYLGWGVLSPEGVTGFAVSAVALVLLSYGLGQFPRAPVADPISSVGTVLGASLKLLAGALLGVAAATSLGEVKQKADRAAQPRQRARTGKGHTTASEVLVRGALLCLAIALAIDTWWLQKVGLGNANDAQQAGMAIVWMIYFLALRLRNSPRWRGWPWASVLAVGFVCTLPIVLNVAWLGSKLSV